MIVILPKDMSYDYKVGDTMSYKNNKYKVVPDDQPENESMGEIHANNANRKANKQDAEDYHYGIFKKDLIDNRKEIKKSVKELNKKI